MMSDFIFYMPWKIRTETGTDLGIVYEHQTMVHSCRGDVEGALRYLELAKEVGNPPRAADDYILQRVRVYLENDRLEEAQDSVVEALDVADDIDKPVDLYLAAQMVFENGYYNEAIAMFTDLLKVASKDPNAPKIHAFLAYSYMQIGEDENALHHLKIAQDGEAENLLELFCADFPNVQAAELYDYYYYRVFGRWPL